MRIVVLNVGHGKWHPKGSKRLADSCRRFAPYADLKIWTNSLPNGCPPHSTHPYAFKTHAFQWAMKEGYDIAFWFDSSIWLKKELQPIVDKISEDGYFVIRNGWTASDWLCDNQVECTGKSREQLKAIPLCIAGAIGFDLKKYGDMLNQWHELSNCFLGEWTNTGKCSMDETVLGSRHDQSFLSVLCHDYNIQLTNPQGYLSYNVQDNVILAAQGM